MNLKKVIGIISYLPEDLNIREIRFNKLKKLIKDCLKLFNIPIYIVTQSWKQEEINETINLSDNISLNYNPDKLGITGARKQLRNWFINSSYDYLIMLDDDIELEGNSGDEYLKQIDENPDCFIENNRSRLQLFAISKEIFKKQDFNDLSPEKGEAFEDRIFFYTLCNKFPEKHKKFENTGLIEHAIATGDSCSTWYKNQDLQKMIQRSNEEIKKSM